MGEKREKSEVAFEFLIGAAGLILVVLTKRGEVILERKENEFSFGFVDLKEPVEYLCRHVQ